MSQKDSPVKATIRREIRYLHIEQDRGGWMDGWGYYCRSLKRTSEGWEQISI